MDQLNLNFSEADVEQRVILPLLTGSEYLGISQDIVFAKAYLAPTAFDKKAGKNVGSYPDFAIVIESVQIALIEAKAPGIDPEIGYRELITYAAHLNKQYPEGINPVQRILASNGRDVLAGPADAEPTVRCRVDQLFPGSLQLTNLRELLGYAVIEQLYEKLKPKLRPSRLYYPLSESDQKDAIYAEIRPNTFAAPLAPALKRYLTSKQQNEDPDIYKFAFVEDKLLTSYDATLSSLMKERIVELRGEMSQNLKLGKKSEPHVEEAIQSYHALHPHGDLQLITGAVGTGKSLFTRRYKELLQNPELQDKCHWAFINFNSWTADLNDMEDWICTQFCDSFEKENDFDIGDRQTQDRIFSDLFHRNRAVYEELAEQNLELSAQAKADDRRRWLADNKLRTQGICRYFGQDRRETVIIVLDNVDRQSTDDQIRLFELALWFMDFTKAFLILNLRDDTFERFRDKKPFDAFRTGVSFHVPPPRFIDVVKRRIELIGRYIAAGLKSRLEFSTTSNLRFTYDKKKLSEFLQKLYLEIFDDSANVGKFIQGISGRDVRKGLEIFDAVLRSGHLSEEIIASNLQGGGSEFEFTEEVLLRALMRGDKVLYSDTSGFVANIFYTSDDWDRPNNFLASEILYLLYEQRQSTGTMGLQGYFSVQSIASGLERGGYTKDDVFKCCDYLIGKNLIESDKLYNSILSFQDNVKITYSGFVHLRFLADRVEYVASVLAVTPLSDQATAMRIGEMTAREIKDRAVTFEQRRQIVNLFGRYLDKQYKQWVSLFPGFANRNAGASYALGAVERALGVKTKEGKPVQNVLDAL